MYPRLSSTELGIVPTTPQSVRSVLPPPQNGQSFVESSSSSRPFEVNATVVDEEDSGGIHTKLKKRDKKWLRVV